MNGGIYLVKKNIIRFIKYILWSTNICIIIKRICFYTCIKRI
jgi:hypothetical protein